MYTQLSQTRGGTVRRPIDPRKTNTMLDAGALDDKDGAAGVAVDDLIALIRERKINAIFPYSVKAEIDHPSTPAYVKERASALLYSTPVELNAQEKDLHRKVAAVLQGNAKPETHAADAFHIVEAGKYGTFFVTNDRRRPIKKRDDIADLIPNLWIVTPEEFMEIYRRYEAADKAAVPDLAQAPREGSSSKKKEIALLDTNDRELVQQLLDDTGVIERQFASGVPEPSVVRAVFVPILRRWIAEGTFHRAQKLVLPHRIAFNVRGNPLAIRLCKAGVYKYWMAQLDFGTIGIAAGNVHEEFLHPDGRPKIPLGIDTPPAPQRANIFFDQRVFFWKGEFYTRTDVIKMHANALGGVHLDFRRIADEAHINEIKNSLGFDWLQEQKLISGDEIVRLRADPQRRRFVYDATELVAIDTAQIFARGIRGAEREFVAVLDRKGP